MIITYTMLMMMFMMYITRMLLSAHPKQHEDEGVDDGLQEAETGADARNCKAEQRKLSPESFQSIQIQKQ